MIIKRRGFSKKSRQFKNGSCVRTTRRGFVELDHGEPKIIAHAIVQFTILDLFLKKNKTKYPGKRSHKEQLHLDSKFRNCFSLPLIEYHQGSNNNKRMEWNLFFFARVKRDAPSDLKRLLPLIAFPSRGAVTPLSKRRLNDIFQHLRLFLRVSCCNELLYFWQWWARSLDSSHLFSVWAGKRYLKMERRIRHPESSS